MKKTFLIALFCAAGMTLFAQTNTRRYPPSSVQRSWQRDYPNRDNDAWEYRNNQWHTKYYDRDHNNREVHVYYDRYGRRVYSQTQWYRNDLPDRVRNRIRSRYRTENYSAYRVERPRGRSYFQIRLGNNRLIYLDERGRETRNR